MNTFLIVILSVLTLWEVARMVFAKRLYTVCKEYASQRDGMAKRFYVQAHPVLKLTLLMDVTGLMACIIGLFSAYWYVFAFVLLMSFFRIRSINAVWFGIDAAITVALYGGLLADLIK